MTAAPARRQPEPAEPGLAVYVHWPFCRSKCPYCDFNSHVRASIDQAQWRRALLRELDHFATETARRRVTSVFFGGGTPSLMAPRNVEALLDRIALHWTLAPDVEVTLEANPTSSEAAAFDGFRLAGINRLSLGVQALDDADLGFLGRTHDAAEALAALDLARDRFPRVSCDLIYARPGQDRRAWRDELTRILARDTEHLSLYQLTIEEGTAFHAAARRGELTVPDAARAAELFEATQECLTAAGRPAYEISNHARPGAECRHNLTYWSYGDYVGIGPGAHGRLSIGGEKVATRQHRAPEAWLDLVARQGHGTRARQHIVPGDRLAELTMMGLRLTEGIARAAFERELGAPPERLYDPARIGALSEAGYLVLDAAGLRATAAGRLRLNAVLQHLLA